MENQVCKIKVIGIGGAGNNAVERMINAGITSAEFIAVNTDKQALLMSSAPVYVQLGKQLTRGLGAGANPEVGEAAAIESRAEIEELLKGSDLVFITAGMGGGTGTGAAPVIAQIARELGILTIAVVTKPFKFEGPKRAANADIGIENLRKHVDTLVIIPNEKLYSILKKGTPIVEAFRLADDVLRQGIQGVADVIVTSSLINLDFADIKTVMENKGLAHMGIGHSSGDNKIIEAVRQAVTSNLLETSIEGATHILLNVKGGEDLPLDEVYDAVDLVREVASKDVNLIFGTSIDNSMKNEVEITVIATGFGANNQNINIKIDFHDNGKDFNTFTQKSTEETKNIKVEDITPKATVNQTEKPAKKEEKPAVESVSDIKKVESETSQGKDDIPLFLRKLKGQK